MDKKDILVIVLKVIIYTCSLIAAALGVAALSSCTIQRESSVQGRAVIVTNDTTVINHSGSITFPKTK